MSPENIPQVAKMQTANLIRRQTAHRLWHRHQSQSYILRTQLGFDSLKRSLPDCCVGCIHYHGKAYGQTLATRTNLVCGFHPYGWTRSDSCPDWQGDI